jgi:hypothetical protein
MTAATNKKSHAPEVFVPQQTGNEMRHQDIRNVRLAKVRRRYWERAGSLASHLLQQKMVNLCQIW